MNWVLTFVRMTLYLVAGLVRLSHPGQQRLYLGPQGRYSQIDSENMDIGS
jgi:hypothetical protein